MNVIELYLFGRGFAKIYEYAIRAIALAEGSICADTKLQINLQKIAH